jgi:DNA-binding MarR family transcriptional regulator
MDGKTNIDRTINRLGALALALGDAQMTAARETSGLGESACATLVTLGAHPGLTIGKLAQIAGLTHSVMVRTVASLEAATLLIRQRGSDRRNVTLRLTASGVRARRSIVAARAAVLEKALKALSREQRGNLEDIMTPMLVGLTTSRDQSDYLCRLCNESACGTDCPVELEACRIESVARH